MAMLDTDPMHQFVVTPVVHLPTVAGVDLSITNASLFMIITALVVSGGLMLLFGRGGLVPTRGQSVAEVLYEFVADTAISILGKDGMKFFPYVFTLFTFIFAANLIGLIPGAYTVTSQLVVTFALAMVTFSIVLIVGFWKNGFGFLRLFVPRGLPAIMVPVIFPIELISFLSRPFSLAIRLFANMMAGHILLKLFGGFIVALAGLGIWGVGIAGFALLLNVAVTGLEILIAFLQAYVFTVLTCIYLNDALHPSH